MGRSREQPSRPIRPLASEAVLAASACTADCGATARAEAVESAARLFLAVVRQGLALKQEFHMLAVCITWAPTQETFAASTRALGPIIDRVSESQIAIRLLAVRDAAVVADRRVASSPAGTQCPAPGHSQTSSLCWVTASAEAVGACCPSIPRGRWTGHGSRANAPHFRMFRGGRLRQGRSLPIPGCAGAEPHHRPSQ